MKFRLQAILFTILLVISTILFADPPQRTAIKAGQLLDVTTGKMTPNAFIVVENDRIVSIGTSAPSGVPIIDLSGATVMPGLIDCHVHLLFDWRDLSSTQPLRISSPQAVLWGLHNVQVYLGKGFTALRDAGEPDLAFGQFALRDSIRSGLVTGPRMFCAGNFISVTGGHGDADVLSVDQALPRRPNLADTVDEVRTAVRHDLKYGADWIKLMATGGVLDAWSDYNNQELSDEQLAAAVEVAHRAGKKVMAHAEGTAGIKAAARAGVDSIEHGTVMDEEGAALMEQKGIWLVPTLFTFQDGMDQDKPYAGMDPVSFEKSKTILKYQQPAFELALKHHLKIAFGLDNDPEKAPREFQSLVKAGLTPLQALQAATVNAASLLGQSDQIGSLQEGKMADIIAVQGNPLQDIKAMENVVFVMKGGQVFKGDKGDKSR